MNRSLRLRTWLTLLSVALHGTADDCHRANQGEEWRQRNRRLGKRSYRALRT